MKIGIIGGSGFYNLDDIPGLIRLPISDVGSNPFGPPSSVIERMQFKKHELFFISRHGEGHVFNPSEVPYRSNIYAMKELGVDLILGFGAVGSFATYCPPSSFVLPDQLIDGTKGVRPRTFFERGCVAHVNMAKPYCAHLRARVQGAASNINLSVPTTFTGTYFCMEGPAFSTSAESQLNAGKHHALVVGMTAAPEAYLAREAEICYSSVCLVTDFDSMFEDQVSASDIAHVMKQNNLTARMFLLSFLNFIQEYNCECKTALSKAVLTDPKKIDPVFAIEMKPFLSKYYPQLY